MKVLLASRKEQGVRPLNAFPDKFELAGRPVLRTWLGLPGSATGPRVDCKVLTAKTGSMKLEGRHVSGGPG